MTWRIVAATALSLAGACTIFNGLNPTSMDASTDRRDAGGPSFRDALVDVGTTVPSCDGGLCNPGVGLCAPQVACSSSSPCADATVLALDGAPHAGQVTATLDPPKCLDAGPFLWDGGDGLTRAACVYGTPAAGTKPLVIFIHQLGGSADDIYSLTGLPALADSFDGGAGTGFVLAADQGENLHSASSSASGPAHDFYYRDFTANPDFKAIDGLIDTLVGMGHVDPSRIYMMGWEQGAFFAEEYAIIRNVTATPANHRVAAVAVFDGADPFQGPATQEQGCSVTVYPKTSVPLAIVHRACSFVACNSSQAMGLADEPPGYDVEGWLAKVPMFDDGGAPVDQIINDLNTSETRCASTCTSTFASETKTWPKPWESWMLGFLFTHTLREVP